MGGYQSDSGSGSISFLRNKGFLTVSENRPFPPGLKNDVWIIECDDSEGGQVGAMFSVVNGDIILCIKDNPGGNFIQNAWMVLPRDPDFEEEDDDDDDD